MESPKTFATLSNPMLQPRIEKVVVNISVGASGEPLERAKAILNQLTGAKPYERRAKKTIREFGIRKGEPIACLVTLRRQKALDFLKRAIEAIGNRLPSSSFDYLGNVSFGIKSHLDFPGIRYDPKLGTVGMDVCVSVARPGYRVARRRISSRIGKKHRVTKEEAIRFFKETLGVEITEE
ncbi:MAG: 50S ribosomal protein L5 [Candidatus Bathyarchaeia archaeon]